MNMNSARWYLRAIPVPLCASTAFLLSRSFKWDAKSVIFGLSTSLAVALLTLSIKKEIGTTVYSIVCTLLTAFLTAGFAFIYELYNRGNPLSESIAKGSFVIVASSLVIFGLSVPGFILLICSDLFVKRIIEVKNHD